MANDSNSQHDYNNNIDWGAVGPSAFATNGRLALHRHQYEQPFTYRYDDDGHLKPVRAIGKVRLRVQDGSGKPQPGAQMRLRVMKSGETVSERTVTAGPTGYISADLLEEAAEDTRIAVSPTVDGQPRHDGGLVFDVGSGDLSHGSVITVSDEVDRWMPEGRLEGGAFLTPPDPADVANAPELFSPQVIRRNGNCALDFTASVETRQFYFNQIVRVGEPELGEREALAEMAGERRPIAGPIPYDWTTASEKGVHQPSSPTLGRLNVYKQSWTRVGHGLGQLLYSLALAPCEETRIAMIEWSREDRARRRDRATARESLQHDMHRDRAIEEIVEGTVDEVQRGGSSTVQGGGGITGGLAGIAKGVLGSVGFSLGGSAASSSSFSSGHREITANTLQSLMDSVEQRSTRVRSQRSMVVTQSQQAETEDIRTRIVRNHNRNHAMTVEYFQVLEHYNVQTELVDQLDVLMIPYEVPTALWDDIPSFSSFDPLGAMRTLRLRLSDSGTEVVSRMTGAHWNLTVYNENQPTNIDRSIFMARAINEAVERGLEALSTPNEISHHAEMIGYDAWVRFTSKVENFLVHEGGFSPHEVNISEDGGVSVRGSWLGTTVDADGTYSDDTIFRQNVQNLVRQVINNSMGGLSWVQSFAQSSLISWLDRYSDRLRELIPSEYQTGLDALYRLVHTPEIYEETRPEITVSRWTVELREPWRAGVSLLVHTTEGGTVTLQQDDSREASAVSVFTSQPVPIASISGIEVMFSPKQAVESEVVGVGETIDNVGDVAREVAEFFGGSDDTPFKERVFEVQKYNLTRLRVTAHTDPSDVLPRQRSVELIDQVGLSETLKGDYPAYAIDSLNPVRPDIIQTRTRRYQDYSALEALAQHIKSNRMAYLRALWLGEDPDRRALRLEPFSHPYDHGDGQVRNVPLLQLIENRAVGVMGNLVAFPLQVQGQRLQADESLSAATYLTLDEMRTQKLISLPTRGVYAETLLSKCNATEVRDVDRMIDPSQRCQGSAPEISGVSPGSRAHDIIPQAASVPSSSINIQSAPPAPAPSGLSGMLNALATGGIFRDMSLGSETVNAARQLASRAMQESGEAQRSSLQALTSLLSQAEQQADSDARNASSTNQAETSRAAQQRMAHARQVAEEHANQAHRQSDPVQNRDHQQNLDDARSRGALSEEQYQRSSARLHNAEEPLQPGRDFPSVKELNVEVGEEWARGKILLADFGVGSSDLTPAHKEYLKNQLVPNLGDEGRFRLIEGHTSETGSTSSNQTLSEQRAQSVRDYLIDTLGIPNHRILNVTGVGETEPIDAEGPLEDPAERSVVVAYEAITPVPVIKRPEVPVRDPGGKKFTNWQLRLQFQHDDSLEKIFGMSPMDIPKELLKAKSIKFELRNRTQGDAQTVTGQIVYRGLSFGIWLNPAPSDSTSWTPWIDFTSETPMSAMEWHGTMGDLQIGTGSLGDFTSGVQAIVLRLSPMANEIQTQARLTSDDKAIGVQASTSLLTPLPAQMWLTDPKPEMKPKAQDWGWEWSPF
ncbi:OmpA family protein [Halomonas beimenensis]|uniref:Transcriptional regulator, IclR family n=1 Tax=Halomonas beimenensis TaxID=475662 RepID=A0A291P9P9_9GAMM|nr:OmpA family protein [Halomonas beimenensis]ATJ83604.1 transcriptional regulator, IclR family [Halomonas beimenensis]